MSRDDGSTQALDSPANERIRRWEWLSERIGWLAMIAILAAACLGLLGKGPVSKRSLATEDGVVRVAFDAVARRDAPHEVRFGIRRATAAEPLRLAVCRTFLQNVADVEWTPPPRAVSATPDAIAYEFRATSTDCELTLRYRHRSWGRQHCDVHVANGASLTLSQVVLP
ncbi:MAG: hypothetical protein DCC68_09880 [Planctomycetota bacterium]|nr:MAG: hypothetical protein DCC68_09880 [Planctomycetota bacterium]